MAIFNLILYSACVSVAYAEPVPSHCGRGRFHGDKRIVGGEESRDGEWPWLVAVMESPDTDLTQACGGTLIAPQWVVSAAHCFDERLGFKSKPEDYLIRLGEHDLTDGDAYHTDVSINKIIMHPGFNADVTGNSDDIALLKMSGPVAMSDRVNVACLPEKDEAFPSICTSAGWGKLEQDGDHSDVVRHLEVNMLETSVCDAAYPENDKTVWDKTICAGDITVDNKGTCNGDSGGPLVCYDEADKEWMLAGLVSGGGECGNKKYPGIYTHIPSFLEWIDDTIAAN